LTKQNKTMEKVRLEESEPLQYIWNIPTNANVAGVDITGSKFYAVRSFNNVDRFILIMRDSRTDDINDLFDKIIFDSWTSVHKAVGPHIKELYTFEDRKEMYRWLGED